MKVIFTCRLSMKGMTLKLGFVNGTHLGQIAIGMFHVMGFLPKRHLTQKH